MTLLERQRVAKRSMGGFTLIELLVALGVFALLAGFAAPSFTRMIEDSKRDAALYALTGDLQFARSESIKTSTRHAVCARTTGDELVCNDSNNFDWARGWLVFTDEGSDRGRFEPGTETLLRVAEPVNESLKIKSRARVSTSAITEAQVFFIRFGPRGTSNWTGGGYLMVCDKTTNDDSRAIATNVTLSGDVRRARRDDTGKLVDAFGKTPTCT